MKDHPSWGHLSLMVMTMPIRKLGWLYIQSIDYDLWLSIENGPHKPTKIKDCIMISKAKGEYIDSGKKLLLKQWTLCMVHWVRVSSIKYHLVKMLKIYGMLYK
jgi:hypothetical protein